MKKIGIITIVVFFAQCIFAQYIPMLDEGAVWYGNYDLEGWKYNFSITVDGDSLIDGKIYKKLEYTTSDSSLNDETFFWREDTVEQKVYRYGFFSKKDILEFDFSLGQGDTLQNYTHSVLDTILDTPLDVGGSIVYHLPPNTRVFIFRRAIHIEGIGMPTRVLSGFLGVLPQLVCHYNSKGEKDLEASYAYSGYPFVDCKGDSVSISTYDINADFFIDLYPNPCVNNLHIKMEKGQGQKHISIYDMLGMKISNLLFSGFEYDVDVSNLTKGIYFFQVVLDGELIGVKKFVKK